MYELRMQYDEHPYLLDVQYGIYDTKEDAQRALKHANELETYISLSMRDIYFTRFVEENFSIKVIGENIKIYKLKEEVLSRLGRPLDVFNNSDDMLVALETINTNNPEYIIHDEDYEETDITLSQFIDKLNDKKLQQSKKGLLKLSGISYNIAPLELPQELECLKQKYKEMTRVLPYLINLIGGDIEDGFTKIQKYDGAILSQEQGTKLVKISSSFLDSNRISDNFHSQNMKLFIKTIEYITGAPKHAYLHSMIFEENLLSRDAKDRAEMVENLMNQRLIDDFYSDGV